MKRDGKGPREYFVKDGRLFELVIVDQGVAQAMGNFELGRKDKKWEKELDAGAIFDAEVTWRDLYQLFGLTTAGIAGHVERVFYPGNDEKPHVVIRGRFVAHVKGHFDKNGFHLPDIEWVGQTVAAVFEIPFRKGKSREKAEIKIISNLEVGDNSQVKAGAADGFNDPDAVVLQKVGRAVGLEPGSVKSQRYPEVVGFLLKIEEVVVAVATKFLSLQGRSGKEKHQENREHQDVPYFSAE